MPIATDQYQPTRTRGTPTDDGDFIVFEHVAVFDEHEGEDGVVYDDRLLKHISDNCNRRIRDSGDWCPLVLAHTRDAEDKEHANDDPPVIGLAGPFYVSSFGEERPRPCIFTKFWVFPEYEKVFLRNPRRSVEIWPEERPEDRYFDPIAILGSETPKRDLGMIYSRPKAVGGNPHFYFTPGPLRYSKKTPGQRLKYQEISSTPGGSNTYIPGETKRQRHEKGETMPLSQAEIQQIAEAMKPIIQEEVAQATVAIDDTEPVDLIPEGGLAEDLGGGELGGGELGVPEEGLGMGAPGPEAFGGMELTDELPDEDELDMGGDPGLEMEDPDMEGELDLGGEELGEDIGGPPPEPIGGDELDLDEEDQMYARGLGRQYMKYGMAPARADKYMEGLDVEDREILGKYFKYLCDDDDAKQKYTQRYGKSPIGGDDITEKSGDSTPSGSMNEDEMSVGKSTKCSKKGKPTVQKYKKLVAEQGSLKKKYSKLNRDHLNLKARYSRLQVEKESQEERIDSLQSSERDANRKSVFVRLESEGYCLEPDDEMDLTRDYTEDQFDRHTTETIPTKYTKISGDFAVPAGVISRGLRKPSKSQNNRKVAEEKHADEAGKLVMRYRNSGRNVTYAKVLDNLIENSGSVKEETLFNINGNGNGNGKA
tara:strand:- start:9355 stop:11307 length:1953 start_codon:yes stop_codon:yes gene_type:complete